MHGFTFKPGDTLLDGYTVERPLGHGGFGEVYHAKSAAGKDVALKLIQRFLEVELRGVGHCLNLKHPNLVTIYDVRPDSEDRQWIVMEYVAGESLSDAVQKHPDGMPVEEALRWFEPICQAVEHLHQSGIVHRDLKPGNIFDDRGTVKVGDYGLAKFITASKRSAQTQSVGTLHYMAPEVGSGRYGREVDVYAVGVILYEMLTGSVPFDGETPAEILMKHLTSRPDLDKLPVAFRGVVARMLAKNPNDRYGSVLSALNDLKAKIADYAHGEAIGEPSQYPAYEESIISRPGMSDWLERPFDVLPAANPRGGLLRILGDHPVLCGLFSLLCLIAFAVILHATEAVPDGDASISFTIVFVAIGALLITIFGFLLRPGQVSANAGTASRSVPSVSSREPREFDRRAQPLHMHATEIWEHESTPGRASRRPADQDDVQRAAPYRGRDRHAGFWLVLVGIAVLLAAASLLGVVGGVTWAGIVVAMILLAVGLAGLAGGGRWAATTLAIMLLPALLYWLVARSSKVDAYSPGIRGASVTAAEAPALAAEAAEAAAPAVPDRPTYPAPVPVPSVEALEVYADEGAFKCRPPMGWHAESGSDAGLAWLRLRRGNASIEIREVEDLGHALARPDRQPDQTVEGVALDGQSGELIRTATSTIFRGDLTLEIICRGPDRDWESLQPVFDKVIASIEADNRT